jgi:alkanesulfonate monooxygenase SsuD/methylene tetrahydromethanopterin reductase-like flavin-dependent oxidoreductase (luciferase family)
MKLSLSITDFTLPGGPDGLAEHLGHVVTAADDAGLDTVWVPDHLLQGMPGRAPTDEMLEAYTTLGFLAARSTRVRLGTAVSAVTFRPPALLIKAVSTLDVLSGGRARLGLGAGYLAQEATDMGLPLPPTRERFEHLEDTLRLAGRMFAGDDSPFVGTRHRLDRPINSPRPRRRPSILVGGTGEQRTLRLVARYADACNVFDIPDGGATITRKLGVLAEHCAAVGRPYADIEKTVSTRLSADEAPGAFIERCAALAALGIEHALVLVAGPWTDAALDTLATARPMLDGVAAG